MAFYTPKKILETGAIYNMIIGERSNGKTYSILRYALINYLKNRKQLAIVRRWADDFKGVGGPQYYEALVTNGEVTKLSKGEWNGIRYRGQRWYLTHTDKDGEVIQDDKPLAFALPLTAMEHTKSTSFPDVTTIVFDEFITRGNYLPDEFTVFCNVISTVVRHRDDVIIFMLANTVNKWACPYFNEMGLTNIRKMQPGQIDVYKFGDSRLRVAVEYVKPNKQGKPSDVYFAFNNPKLSMITGGAWEIAVYPHCPCKYLPKDILFTYYVNFDGEWLRCNIIQHEDLLFTFVHPQTTPLSEYTLNHALIYSSDYDPRPNYRRKINKPTSDLEKRGAWFYAKDKVFFATNETGELMRSYLQWCGKPV